MRHWYVLIGLLLAIALPPVATALDQTFYVSFASRIIIFALVASSLNLVLGYGGMLSFGHTAFFGAGAYTVAILAQHGVHSAWIAWPLAMLVAALLALPIGAMSLRTRGVYFIMITLAFAQMIYYVFVSLKTYGGDDGLTLAERSGLRFFGFGIDLKSDAAFYYVCLALLAAVLWLLARLAKSRFGHALGAIKMNEVRAEAIGFPTYRIKLACFVLAAALAGLGGALIANQNNFVSPTLMHWTQSGMLMVMLIVGGSGHLLGGVIGAAVLLLLEETLSAHTQHWQLVLGIVLLAIVLFAQRGVAGIFARKAA
jgi:branched-chain amino acid transport system permease protein